MTENRFLPFLFLRIPAARIYGASGRNRTNDTGIFSPLLYLLSYLGMAFSR